MSLLIPTARKPGDAFPATTHVPAAAAKNSNIAMAEYNKNPRIKNRGFLLLFYIYEHEPAATLDKQSP